MTLLMPRLDTKHKKDTVFMYPVKYVKMYEYYIDFHASKRTYNDCGDPVIFALAPSLA